jgi:hypothetical protein
LELFRKDTDSEGKNQHTEGNLRQCVQYRIDVKELKIKNHDNPEDLSANRCGGGLLFVEPVPKRPVELRRSGLFVVCLNAKTPAVGVGAFVFKI